MPAAAKKKSAVKVLIAAGGTGGHIVPGIALAQEFQRQGQSVSFLSLKKNQNYADLKGLLKAMPLYFYDAPPLPQRKFPPRLFSFLAFFVRFFKALCRAYLILKKYKIDLVVGMGGYPMIPALTAALILRKPYALCEQNALAGLGTRLFAKKAQALFLNFPLKHAIKKIELAKIPKIYCKGNPLRTQMLSLCEKQLKAKRLPKKTEKTDKTGKLHVLVLGGSQGALQINRILAQLVPSLGGGFQWTIQCGVSHLREMAESLPAHAYPHLRLIGYSSAAELGKFYMGADLLVCRAGAGVLSEALCFGLPLVLIPYPYAADAHQEANADHLSQAGAALVCKQKDIKPERLLQILKKLKEDPQKREAMGQAALALARPQAAKDIAYFLAAREFCKAELAGG